MLTLYRLPRVYRVLYAGIAILLVAAVWSHWLRLGLRHGWTPTAVTAWYVGDEAAMLFRKVAVEVGEDAWMNLFHHTLAFLVLGGLLVRTSASARTKATLVTLFGGATLASAAAPLLVWWGVPGSATLYVAMLAVLSAITLIVAGLVVRDAWIRHARGDRELPGSDVLTRAVLLATVLLGLPASSSAQTLMSERQATMRVFPEASGFVTDSVRLDSATRSALERELGRPLFEPVYPFRRIFAGARFLGFTLVTEERGKYRPITMLIAADSARRVAGVQILVYREPRGGEVAREYFLRQYRGKSIGNPIRLNRDIINISGATISVHSVNAGVRKTLALIERVFPASVSHPAALTPIENLP